MSRKKQTTVTLEVRLTVPDGSNAAELMQYVRDAIKSHRGGLSPDEPIFNSPELDHDNFVVKLVRKETVYG